MPLAILPLVVEVEAERQEKLQPFRDIITPDRIRHHFVGQNQAKGVYAKEIHIPAAHFIVSHSHPYDHLSIVARGAVKLTVDGESRFLHAPAALTIVAGKEHAVYAITDSVWYCIHPTDETDPEKVDEVILRKAD